MLRCCCEQTQTIFLIILNSLFFCPLRFSSLRLSYGSRCTFKYFMLRRKHYLADDLWMGFYLIYFYLAARLIHVETSCILYEYVFIEYSVEI